MLVPRFLCVHPTLRPQVSSSSRMKLHWTASPEIKITRMLHLQACNSMLQKHVSFWYLGRNTACRGETCESGEWAALQTKAIHFYIHGVENTRLIPNNTTKYENT